MTKLVPAAAVLALAACAVDRPSVPPHRLGAQPSADQPDAALRWRRLRWQDAGGRVPADGLARALAARQRNADHWSLLGTAGITPSNWTERGPANVGGRSRSLVIHPTQPSRMWAGAVGGGVWYSSDGGSSWTPVDDRMSRLSVGCLTMDPSDSNVLYAGTGEGFFNGDALAGDGVYRSVDGGGTWSRLPATASWTHVNRIAISPANPSLLLAATRGGIHRSLDRGASWSTVLATNSSFQVVIDPNDAAKAVGHAYDGSAHRVVYSNDAGQTWTTASSGLASRSGFNSRIELAYAPSAPGTVYANCSASNGEVWRSIDGGVNWTLRSSGYGNPFGWYCNPIWVDPTDANLVVVGSNHVYRSTNGGASLTRISNGYLLTSQPHPDIHLFVPHPGYDGSGNRQLFVTTDGGVYHSSDIRNASRSGSGTWSSRDRQYRTTQFYGAAGHGPAAKIVGGTQDNGTLKLDGTGNNAVLTFGGDGGFAAVDADNPNYTYGEYVYLQIHRSTDGGNNASYIYSGIGDAGSNANFIAPFILDPNDQRRMLAGGASLWRCNDVRAGTPAWSAIKPGVGSNIAAIAVAPGNADVVWVGHNDGRVYMTVNGTAAAPTWNPVDDNASRNPLPNRYCTRLLIDPDDANTVYACFGGFSTDNLWRSSDGGASWRRLTGSGPTALPPAPVNGLARHPRFADYLYAGTEVGVFASVDGGATWATANDGPTNASIDEIVFLHRSEVLLLATHGRGLFTAEVQAPAATPYGAPCAGTAGTPRLALTRGMPPTAGGRCGFDLDGLPGGGSAAVVLGTSRTLWNGVPLPLDLGFLQMPGCALHCSIDQLFWVPTGSGSTTTTVPIPAVRYFVGRQFFATVLCPDPGANPAGFITANGLECTIGY